MNEVLIVLNSNRSAPKGNIALKVGDSWVILEGELSLKYQKEIAIYAYKIILHSQKGKIKIRVD